MLESIQILFDFATSGLKVGEELVKILKKRKGKARLLLEELKHNHDLLVMVVEEDTHHFKVIPRFKTTQYDALLEQHYKLDSISKKRIKRDQRIEKSDLRHFAGKRTAVLIENIYDKIKQIKNRYEIDRNNKKIAWRRRILNLYKRLVLLTDHLRK